MVRTIAWFLNFDADDELARPVGYTPSRAVLARSTALREQARLLPGPQDVVVSEVHNGHFCSNYVGIAWCPTPRALRALRKAGAEPAPAPPLDVLRAVNHRGFCAAIGQTLPCARFALSVEEAMLMLASPSPTGQWLVKRPFSFAGRGRLKVDPASAPDVARARPFLEASFRLAAGLQIEPFVVRTGDYGLHGYVRRSGDVILGQPTRQDCDASGAWLSTALAEAGDLSTDERTALVCEARVAGERLASAGYFGPFGVDALRYVGHDGAPRFNPRSEINARYSMGWAIGMGQARPDRDDHDR